MKEGIRIKYIDVLLPRIKTDGVKLGKNRVKELYPHRIFENPNDSWDIVLLVSLYRQLCDVEQRWFYSPIMSSRQFEVYKDLNGGEQGKVVYCTNGRLGIKFVGKVFRRLALLSNLDFKEIAANHILRSLMMEQLCKFYLFIFNCFILYF